MNNNSSKITVTIFFGWKPDSLQAVAEQEQEEDLPASKRSKKSISRITGDEEEAWEGSYSPVGNNGGEKWGSGSGDGGKKGGRAQDQKGGSRGCGQSCAGYEADLDGIKGEGRRVGGIDSTGPRQWGHYL